MTATTTAPTVPPFLVLVASMVVALRGRERGIEWVGDEPMLSRTKHAARCLVCGHEWAAQPASIMQGGLPAMREKTPPGAP